MTLSKMNTEDRLHCLMMLFDSYYDGYITYNDFMELMHQNFEKYRKEKNV